MNVNDIVLLYSNIVEVEQAKLKILKAEIFRIGTFRLVTVLLALCSVYFLWNNTLATVAALFFCLLIFLILVKIHDKLFRKKIYAETKLQYAQNELKALNYDFSAFDGGENRIDPKHRFATDLDLFGKNSVFQSINRTVTSFGADRLADTLLTPFENKTQILRRQQAVKELADKYDFILNFTVEGLITGKDSLNTKNFAGSFSQISEFGKNIFWKTAVYLVPSLYAAASVALIFGLMPAVYLGTFWGITCVLTLLPAKKILAVSEVFDRKNAVLEKYSKLFRILENEHFTSDEINETVGVLRTTGENSVGASKAISQLKSYYDSLFLSFSYFGFLLFNPVFLWNIRYTIKIEQWIDKYGEQIGEWFSALAAFDLLTSSAIFAHNNPEYIYPAIADKYVFNAKNTGHPLLHREHCVRNDMKMEGQSFFLVVTGANMAGKSTYLRTVGVNHILACAGLPVCADEMTVYPARLITNLRTTDSLNDNESYFFAELKRLKMIIDRLNNGEILLIILDEILKGTNSEDKQKGSLALMKQLIRLKSNGIIATHDLALGTLETEFPENVKNYCFEAVINDGKLLFDYKISEGIAKNMNATFLMREMGITVN